MSPVSGSKGVEQASQAFGINRLTKAGKRAGAGEAAGREESSPPDAVSFSDEAKSLSAARQAVQDAPDVRQDKVEAIKQAIADGTFQVSARDLARKLIDAGVV